MDTVLSRWRPKEKGPLAPGDTPQWGGEAEEDGIHPPLRLWSYMMELKKRTRSKLLVISSVWPFDFFPDRIIIDENKVDLIYHDFFWMARGYSVLIENIKTVRVGVGPFFASLSMEVAGFEANPEPVRFLWKHDAIRARRIILGLMACAKEAINFSGHRVDEVRQVVEEIGRAGEFEKGRFALL